MEYIAHTTTEHKRCKFIMSKGYRKGSPCGNGIGIADFDYSTQKLKVYGGLEVGSVDYTITDAEYQELVNLLGGADI